MQTINPDKNKTVYTFPLTTVEWKIDTPRRRDLIEALDDRLFRISDDRHSLVELINDIGYSTAEGEDLIDSWDRESELLFELILEGPSSTRLEKLSAVVDVDRTYFRRILILAAPYLRGTEYETKEVTGATIVYADTD